MVNDLKPVWVTQKIKYEVDNFIKNNDRQPLVALLGIAFKPDIDDLRESPALYVAKSLKDQGCDIVIVEPNIDNHTSYKLTDVNSAINCADILIVMVKHRQFMDSEVREKLLSANAIDFCGAL
jgi:UDP-N-acetyl-D-mannosaminuronic acid dehydrogenase